jgi:hypothetical protein
MQESVPGLPFAVDPLIAEAKRRRRRRWLLSAAAIAAAAAAAVGVDHALQPPSHRLTTPPFRRFGIARIPGMTRIFSRRVQSDFCFLINGQRDEETGECGDGIPVQAIPARSGLDQVWVLKSAAARIGEHRLRHEAVAPPNGYFERLAYARAVSLPPKLIERHRGPLEVQVWVRPVMKWDPRRSTLGYALAPGWARRGAYAGLVGLIGTTSWNPSLVHFVPLRSWAINGGAAGQYKTPWNGGMTRFQFAWAAGPRVVLVSVLGGPLLTVREAQRVAALAGPSSG